jgi:hypothetical protein
MWARSAVCGLLDANVGRLDDNVGLRRRLLDTNVGPFWPCLWARPFLNVGRYRYQKEKGSEPARSKLRGIAPKEIEKWKQILGS